MDPSGYCHRKPNRVWTLSLPPSSSRRFGHRTASRLPSEVLASALRQFDRRSVFRLPLEALQLKALTHRVSHPQNRTGWISVARLTLTGFLNPLTFPLPRSLSLASPRPHKSLFGFSFRSWFQFASLRSRFGSLSYSLLPVPYSLFSRSSPRPISITKLHTLLRFHR